LLPRSNGNFFINADTVAAGLSPNHGETASFQAGRFVLQEIRKAILEQRSFCFETTLSGLGWQKTLEQAKASGFKVIIYFVFVDKIDISAKRIAKRVKEGGHNIPLKVLKRRTPRSFSNFWQTYRNLADDWYVFDNSRSMSKLICSSKSFETMAAKQKDVIQNLFLTKGRISTRGLK
jgi:predicted ABC-type ATPase